MTEQIQENQVQETDKEKNFRAFEAKYQKQIEAERAERERLQREIELLRSKQQEEEEDDSEPYVDHKRLNKTLEKHGQATQSEIQKAMENAKYAAKEELKQEMWLESNPDFYDVLKHAQKFAEKAPRLAESILRMPDGFERQKLVYENIKTLGIDKPEQKVSSIQEKVDANRRSPYYQPSNVNPGPYSSQGDFSPTGQKAAYDKMKQLQSTLRI